MSEPDLIQRGGCKWMTTFEHAFMTGSLRKPDKPTVKCCNCGTVVDYTASWVTVPYGLHGNRLPLPVFIHCVLCVEALEPQYAYQRAYLRDLGASLPDPEKVKREEALNEYWADQVEGE